MTFKAMPLKVIARQPTVKICGDDLNEISNNMEIFS